MKVNGSERDGESEKVRNAKKSIRKNANEPGIGAMSFK